MSIYLENNASTVSFSTAGDVQIFTIGYEKRDILSFVQLLRRSGIQRVIDVRKNPISRKKGFSKSTLKAFLEKYKIEYVHIPQLGIPSAYRTSLQTPKDYEDLFRVYTSEMLPQVQEYVSQAASLIAEKPSALMCFEYDPKQCHRSCLAQKIHEVYSYSVKHIS